MRYQARRCVGKGAGAERHHDAHRTVGPIGLTKGGGNNGKGCKSGSTKQAPAIHDLVPRVLTAGPPTTARQRAKGLARNVVSMKRVKFSSNGIEATVCTCVGLRAIKLASHTRA